LDVSPVWRAGDSREEVGGCEREEEKVFDEFILVSWSIGSGWIIVYGLDELRTNNGTAFSF